MFASHVSQAGSLEFVDKGSITLSLEPSESEKTGFYEFTNTGSSVVKVVRIKSSCGCTVTEMDKKIFEPQETGKISVTYKAGSNNQPTSKTILVVTDEAKDNFYNLALNVEKKQSAKVDPAFVEWRAGTAFETKTIDVQINQPYSFHISEAESTNDTFVTKLSTVEPNKRYRVTVTPSRTDLPATALIRLKTTDPAVPVVHARARVLPAQGISTEQASRPPEQ